MKSSRRPKIYISGPLTSSGDQLDNVECAIEWCRHLIQDGFAPLCPHLTYYVDPDQQIAHSVWMDVDLPWVDVADAVFRLPGKSVGADLETDRAFESGVPIYQIEDYDLMVSDLLGVIR